MVDRKSGTSGLGDIYSFIDSRSEASVARLIDYVRRPSISAEGLGIAEVADYIAGEMRGIGLDTEVVQTAGWPMVLGRHHKRPGCPTVLLYGHYDVQPPDPLDEWRSPPFEPEIRDGKLYGRGVGDNKGQHLAQILAIEALLSVDGELPCNVTVLLEGEEEIGSPQMAPFVDAHRDDLVADLVITSDGPVHESGAACVVFGVRGVLNFELRATGANRDLHSGNWGGIVPNPIWTLVHLLGTMKNQQGEITIDGVNDDIMPLTAVEHAALDRIPADVEGIRRGLNIAQLDRPLDRGLHERTCAWPTLTINGLHGGYGGPGSKTVLPHYAVAKCDMRLVAAQRAEDVFENVKAHVQRHAPEVEIVFLGAMNPSKTELDSRYAEPLRQAIKSARGEDPLLFPSLGGSLPTHVFTTVLGMPSFVIPYANADESNHAPNENIEIDRFIGGIKTGAAMLTYLGAMADTGGE